MTTEVGNIFEIKLLLLYYYYAIINNNNYYYYYCLPTIHRSSREIYENVMAKAIILLTYWTRSTRPLGRDSYATR
jgi:hypothetical protein